MRMSSSCCLRASTAPRERTWPRKVSAATVCAGTWGRGALRYDVAVVQGVDAAHEGCVCNAPAARVPLTLPPPPSHTSLISTLASLGRGSVSLVYWEGITKDMRT